jgi:hypothetical protein
MAAVLVCGHQPSPHSEFTTGTAHTRDGREICWTCADAEQRDEMRIVDRFTAYLVRTKDGAQLQTWSGGLLATVTASWSTSAGGFARRTMITRFRAVDSDGVRWFGTSPGYGMYARMRRAKGSPNAA